MLVMLLELYTQRNKEKNSMHACTYCVGMQMPVENFLEERRRQDEPLHRYEARQLG